MRSRRFGQDLCVWSVESALPSGLTINPASGFISGCAKEEAAVTTYRVIVRNKAGIRMTLFILRVAPAPPSSFACDLLCKNALQVGETVSCFAKLAVLARSSSQDLYSRAPDTCEWSVEPALLAGLNTSPASGLIRGCEKEEVTETTYTVTARNTAGSRTSQFILRVELTPPSSSTYDLPVKMCS